MSRESVIGTHVKSRMYSCSQKCLEMFLTFAQNSTAVYVWMYVSMYVWLYVCVFVCVCLCVRVLIVQFQNIFPDQTMLTIPKVTVYCSSCLPVLKQLKNIPCVTYRMLLVVTRWH